MNAQTVDRLSDEDTQILKLGRGTIRGHTCKLLVMDPGDPSPQSRLDAMRDRVAARLDAAPRFRQRVVRTPLHLANPVWVDDPGFDITRHITPAPSDGPLTRHELTELVARLMAHPLDQKRPLWHMSVVERLTDGGFAVIWRVHHSVADGTVCIRLADALLWDQEPSGDSGPRPPWRPTPSPGRATLLATGLAERAARWRHREHRAHAPFRTTEAVVARELRPAASPTRLDVSIGRERSVAFASVSLQQARQAGKAIDPAVTVNDVVLSIIAGAVRSWLGTTEAIRVKVPVSLHAKDETVAVSNHDSYFFVDLPVAEPDPVKRLLSINRETEECKLNHDAETLYTLGAHPAIARWCMSPRVFTFNISNVRGPQDEVSVLGSRVRELWSLAEVGQHHALRVAVLSASGSLFFGLCADRAAVPDLDGLAQAIHDAAAQLLAVANGTGLRRGA
jgi:WS/DGAT/MGAT family acyltransferase